MVDLQSMRLDKWLWAARFFKSRGLAQKDIELGRVKVNGERVKSSKNIEVGNVIEMCHNNLPYKFTVKKLTSQRRPAVEARQMYLEDEKTVQERETLKLQLSSNAYSSPYREGRPTKKDRREIDNIKKNLGF